MKEEVLFINWREINDPSKNSKIKSESHIVHQMFIHLCQIYEKDIDDVSTECLKQIKNQTT